MPRKPIFLALPRRLPVLFTLGVVAALFAIALLPIFAAVQGAGGASSRIDASATRAARGDRVYFDGGNSYAPSGAASYTWDFGDGQIAHGSGASHVFEKAGTYDVKLTVVGSNANETDTATITIVVEDVIVVLIPYITLTAVALIAILVMSMYWRSRDKAKRKKEEEDIRAQLAQEVKAEAARIAEEEAADKRARSPPVDAVKKKLKPIAKRHQDGLPGAPQQSAEAKQGGPVLRSWPSDKPKEAPAKDKEGDAAKDEPKDPATETTPCPACGKPVSEFAVICENCGAIFSDDYLCTSCGASVPDDRDECPKCGAKLV